MSGGFNFGQQTGFSFGAQRPAAPAAAAAPAGFGMSAGPAAPAPAGGGFSFGAAAQPSAAPAGGFSFGTPANSAPAPAPGFSFGTPGTTNAAGFGQAGAAPAAAPAGLALGSVAPPGTGFALGGALSGQTAAPPAGGGFSFGVPSQAQPAQAPATAAVAPTTAAAAPAGMSFGAFSFGASKVQMTTAAPAPTGGGFGLGTTAPSSLAQPQIQLQPQLQPQLQAQLQLQPQPQLQLQPASTAAVAATQGGGFSFGIKPSSTPAPPAATQAAPSSGSSLFALPIPSSVAPSAAPSVVPSAAASTAAATGFTLGAIPATSAAIAPTTAAPGGALSFMLKPLGAAAATSAPASTAAVVPGTTATAAAAPGFSLGFKPASSTGIATATATAATITTTAAPPVMTYAQLEGLINKWSLELEDQERHFLQQATQVNAWDRMLVENGEKITALHKEMEKVKLDQRRLNQELDFILSQQKELEDLLCPLEESVKEQSGTIYMQNADEERERTYKLAENVDAQLKRMSQDLKEIIEHLNTSSGPADTSDPLQQICKILNAHMDSLQWIDQNSVLLQRRVEEVSKLCDTKRKEQEKTFRLTFD
ncbi:nuclear pore glycoprotein p62-like [Cololabis saira]|uniref:nuclear pore glycoprotein p62-like n=1 Tax=Cololabis saira TaxID=129043 RepID=UPI002AD5A730|nr:nuclear pore glycoprotein p62-like [Cololabis saira]